ncbi:MULTISPECIES: head maturation protease, ClpP-related [unclassified Sulfitobacter]|uniref:head maturation protease, ClpP-related n=1 Tax=unclassified Sulfitobacter TaxID=196795 RepID=UPI0007C3DF1C|nr:MULTISPECIES: head maturation protease, ClpP-related [unclassified Sulfitobacter]KZY05262.1 peptidase [Sulfitobacter sp. HI0023]KZY26842.1 peptidase [Sulfitobacter sp. HI0040]KZZ67774.1 peptidase [Sulfitobacter sp. HI0129]
MSLKNLPQAKAFERPSAYVWDAPSDALEQWSEKPNAAEADEPNTISIYDVIGEDMWGDGFTAKRAGAALRSIGANAVTVNINSPGGDMFEGLAIYNLLREHPAKVTVKVMGVAASAASIIAMAGDSVLMGTGSVMMIHNAWGAVIGNRHDFSDAANVFETFDASMAAIYSARTGMKEPEIMAMLDGPTRASDGTYMTAEDAIAKGFADAEFEMPKLAASSAQTQTTSLRKLDAALARGGMPRSERRALLAEAKGGTQDAASTVTPGADDWTDAATRLIAAIRS